MKKILLDYDLNELKEIVVSFNEKPFRAEQIFKNLHKGYEFSEMTDLSIALRDKLESEFIAQPTKIIKTLVSRDGTEKFLFALHDGNVVEGVLMKYKYGFTLCISSQVGCRMNCAFCASGIDGLIRNLSRGEMLGEVVCVNRAVNGDLGEKRAITNVVMMGSGEPLDNYDETVGFIKLLSSPKGICLSPRNVSVSTSGIVPKMRSLAEEGLPVNLTVSLHSPFDDKRAEIMPIAKKYKISDIISACDYYFEKSGRRYIFEYVLIRNKSATKDCADRLVSLLKGKPCHVNLIRLNEVKEKELEGITDKEAYSFLGRLEKGGLSATLRRRMGADIDGACGQLRRRYIDELNS